MKKFLSVVRRIFLAGTISLLIIVILWIVGYKGISFTGSSVFGKIYTGFALVSPVMWLIFWLVSTAYVKKNGQSAAYQQTISFGKTMGAMFKSDITSPFRLIGEQFVSKKKLVEYYSNIADIGIATMLAQGSKAINREKLLWLIIRFAVYVIGVMSAINYLRTVFH